MYVWAADVAKSTFNPRSLSVSWGKCGGSNNPTSFRRNQSTCSCNADSTYVTMPQLAVIHVSGGPSTGSQGVSKMDRNCCIHTDSVGNIDVCPSLNSTQS